MYYYHPEVRFLLMDHSDDKVEVVYNSNHQTRLLPAIGPRPPYYCNPRYEPYYPVI